MTWAAVITLAVVGIAAITGAARPGAKDAVGRALLGIWFIACAIALWDRYL